MKNTNNVIFTLALISLFGLSSTYGQGLEGFSFDDNVIDKQAPIHMLVYLGLVVGGYLGVRKLRK